MANSITENFDQREVSFSLNVDFYPEAAVGKSYDSKIFHLTNDDVNYPLSWIVKVFPGGDSPENDDYVSLFLQLITCDKPAYIVDFRICILNKYDDEVHECRSTDAVFLPNRQVGFPRFLTKERLWNPDELMRDNRGDNAMRIVCYISSVVEYRRFDTRAYSLDTEVGHTELPLQTPPHVYKRHRPSERYTTLEARGGVSFGVHKEVLWTHSPRVLAAMLRQKNHENVVNMRDMEPDTVYAILEYLYTDQVNAVIEAKASEVLGAAEKYGLEDLKDQCETILCESLAVENAAECIVLAELHNADRLKSKALNFSAAHLMQVMNKPGFRTAANSRPELAMDILSFIALQYSSGAWPKPPYDSEKKETHHLTYGDEYFTP